MSLPMNNTKRKHIAVEWFKTLEAYHRMKITKHEYKIARANAKLAERLRRFDDE